MDANLLRFNPVSKRQELLRGILLTNVSLVFICLDSLLDLISRCSGRCTIVLLVVRTFVDHVSLRNCSKLGSGRGPNSFRHTQMFLNLYFTVSHPVIIFLRTGTFTSLVFGKTVYFR